MGQGIFGELVGVWKEKLKAAREAKGRFDRTRQMSLYLYSSPDYDDVWKHFNIAPKKVPFPINYNVVADYANTFRPMLQYTYPHRQVSRKRRMQLDPQQYAMLMANGNPQAAMMLMQQKQMANQQESFRIEIVSALMDQYLNYVPHELRWKKEADLCVLDALLGGRGCAWTEIDGHTGLVGSMYDSTDNLLVDPDATRVEDAWWIARKRIVPAWWLRERYGLSERELRGISVSADMEADARHQADDSPTRGRTADLVTVFEVFSKMGWGSRLVGAGDRLEDLETIAEDMSGAGDNVYLVLAPDACDRPLNVNEDAVDGREIAEAVRWPIELHEDQLWPVSCLDFLDVLERPWPMAPIQQVKGEILFLNWAYGHLPGKVKTTCRDFFAHARSLAPEVVDQIKNGLDLAVLELDNEAIDDIDKVMKFIQHPPWQPDIYNMLRMMEEKVRERLGMTDIVTGRMSKQIRTQFEAQSRTEFAKLKPDAMRSRVDDWQSEVARKEALGARSVLRATRQSANAMGLPQTSLTQFGEVLGPDGAMLWDRFVASDIQQAARELEYTIEAGSSRRPDKDRETDNAQMVAKLVAQPYAGLLGQGNVQPWNNMLEMLGKATEYDAGKLKVAPPMMPPMAPPGQMPGPIGAQNTPRRISTPPGGKAPGIPPSPNREEGP